MHLSRSSNLSSLRDAESILQTLATCVGDSEAYSAFESESDAEHNIHSNYRSSHDTPDELEEDGSEHTFKPESETMLPTQPAHEGEPDEHSERTNNRVPTQPSDRQSEEKNNCVPAPPPDRQSEKTDDRVPRPPPEQPLDNDTMSYPYSKYRDDLNAEAHVYAFLHTWEPNHVSQHLTDTKVECLKITKFGMNWKDQQ